MIEIKNRFDGTVLFSGNFDTIVAAVLAAIKEKKDLRYANLSSANLRYANLRSANLSSANISYADLRYANLRYANLSYADPRYANLSSADLSYANLRYADLRYADLGSADLSYADLSSANLRYANLSYADLRSANLRYANLSYANLRSANLDFSCLSFSCKTLHTKFDQKHIIQILYHAAMPTRNNELKLDKEVLALLRSKAFKAVVNKFHRVKECNEFTGPKVAKKKGTILATKQTRR